MADPGGQEPNVTVYRSSWTVDGLVRAEGSPYGDYEPMQSSGQAVSDLLRWIEAEDNPFGMRVLDCRPLSLTTVSVTSKPEIASRFADLRRSTGKEYVGAAPPSSSRSECNLIYPAALEIKEGPLFKAMRFEDKWDIFLYDDLLYFSRSWTGILQFRARLEFSEKLVRLIWIESAQGERHAEPTSQAAKDVDFLIKSHLYRLEGPHSLPADVPDDPSIIAGFSISRYGRWASFATYDDTTSYKPWSR
jgi:hypothetical protein